MFEIGERAGQLIHGDMNPGIGCVIRRRNALYGIECARSVRDVLHSGFELRSRSALRLQKIERAGQQSPSLMSDFGRLDLVRTPRVRRRLFTIVWSRCARGMNAHGLTNSC